MARAARLPSATASITMRGPKARSPPAKTPGMVVASVTGSTATSPRGVISICASADRHSVSGCWPTARITVSASTRFSLPGTNVGLKRPRSSKTDATSSVSTAVTRPAAPDHGLRAPAREQRDALLLRLAHLVGMRGHLAPRLERNQLNPPGAQPERGPGGVDEGVVVAPRVQQVLGAGGQRGRRVLGRVAQRGPRHVDGHVAPSHDDDALAERDVIAQVGVEEEVDAVDHAVQVGARECRGRGRERRRGRETPPRTRCGAGRSP